MDTATITTLTWHVGTPSRALGNRAIFHAASRHGAHATTATRYVISQALVSGLYSLVAWPEGAYSPQRHGLYETLAQAQAAAQALEDAAQAAASSEEVQA